MYLGVDYYPEHWPKEMMDEDIKGIKELGANIVRIGEFAWHMMESKEGNFDFTFFDDVIARLKKEGIKVIFGTPTATFPAWLAKKFPFILSVDENGDTRVFGGRRQYCFNSDIYRKYSARITEELVKHYKDESAIVAWQIDNELGHEGSDMCYCDQCHVKFQEFLKEKYESIDELNERWGTIFWGQTYNDFSEIPIPKKTITTHNPALQLDWARFRSFSVNSFAHEMISIVRKYKGKHQQITTNVSGGFFNKWFDHAENVKPLDFVSYDNYPVWGGLSESIPPAAIAMAHDFNRGLLGKNYWIVEELMGAQGHTVIGYFPRPNQAKMWSYQAFAHGCTDLLYFRWRGMTKGAEQFCYGIVDHDNNYGRKYQEVQSVFNDISQYEEVLRSDINADIAVLYDYDNIWSWRFQIQSEGFDFTNELLRLYSPFYEWNTQIDVIPIERDFSKYKVLLVPVLQIIDEQLAERFRKFVEDGGTIIFSFRAGLKDKNNNIHFKKPLPGYIRDLAGITIHEVESLSNNRSVPVIEKSIGKRYEMSVWRDLIKPDTAEVIFKYGDEFYQEMAAVTRNKYKKGMVYYIGGGLETTALQEIAKEIIDRHDIWHIESEKGVEVYKRISKGMTYLFILNHSSETKMFQGKQLPPFASMVVRR
ncbi:beta-galactosidase [Tepidibacillus fermentans]|uniref:Beta-galactosidase n=1 Tax=Tepidibacillus fermentans TaxID=1281767 RepID=A0A4R3K4R8_9BACI|nr:beta-galactosidase [Tepidibacillus fermentans]TCS77766.1 beta-galactosidase [Tepidibacillus fermentans]